MACRAVADSPGLLGAAPAVEEAVAEPASRSMAAPSTVAAVTVPAERIAAAIPVISAWPVTMLTTMTAIKKNIFQKLCPDGSTICSPLLKTKKRRRPNTHRSSGL